jgi:transcription antitermination factor NusG
VDKTGLASAGWVEHATVAGSAAAVRAASLAAPWGVAVDAASPGGRTDENGDWIVRAVGRWWVLHTRARNEKHVASKLAQHRVLHYLPLVQVHHTYAKRKVAFSVPLFPGYVFLCGEHGDCDAARRTHRVANILYVEDQRRLRAELQHVHRAIAGSRTVELFPSLQVGQRCRITSGALAGLEGIVVRQGRHCRMYLSVSALGQSASVEVDAALLEVID